MTAAELRAETRRAIREQLWGALGNETASVVKWSIIEAAIDAEIAAARQEIADRVRECTVLRLQVDADPLNEINEIIQDLADDIENDWADYDDASEPPR